MSVEWPFIVYREQLSARTYGFALWEPEPCNLSGCDGKVSIGDVGFVRQGRFMRMFNVMLPWERSNGSLAEPESYDPLDGGPFTNTIEAQFDEVVLISRFVTAEANADKWVLSSLPDNSVDSTFW
jgi:hypothetical protein